MIRKGDVFKFEARSDFMSHFNVNYEEIVEALPEAEQEALLEQENELREEMDDPPVEDFSDIHEDVVSQKVTDYGFNSVVMDVLDARDTEYVHLFDGVAHTVVELYPKEGTYEANEAISADMN